MPPKPAKPKSKRSSLRAQQTIFFLSAALLASITFGPTLRSILSGSSSPKFTARKSFRHSSSHVGIPDSLDLLSADMGSILRHLDQGTVTSAALVDAYLDRIERDNLDGLQLKAVLEMAPKDKLMKLAGELDEERRIGRLRGRLHGVPILVKDNIATEAALGMSTTAGSYALLGSKVPRDAHLVHLLRKEGAIILGKTNLSEWANYRGTNITSGWSAIGGQTASAYAKGTDVCGSSSGSGVAASAGWAAATIGTETDGSIICPSSRAALYGLKPTVGLVSRAGIVPISSTQDSPGPMVKSAFDVALILSAIAGPDERDEATKASPKPPLDYTKSLLGTDGFKGLRIGIPRAVFYNDTLTDNAPEINIAIEHVIARMRSLGAHVQDPADLPSALSGHLPGDRHNDFAFNHNELIVLDTDFKADLKNYLAELEDAKVRSLADVINFNDRNNEMEMPEYECCQEILVRAVQTEGQKDRRLRNTSLHEQRTSILDAREGSMPR